MKRRARPKPVHLAVGVLPDRPPYPVLASGEEPGGRQRMVTWWFATAEDRERYFPTTTTETTR